MTPIRYLFIRQFLISTSLLLILAGQIFANEIDTLFVRTFTFDSLSTRRAEFDFPTDHKSWSKVLMYYTLKCDSATTGDPYPCGEWDVNTYSRVFRHTEQFDSLKHRQPHFIVEGETPNQFRYSERPLYDYVEKWDKLSNPSLSPGDHYLTFDGTDYLKVPAEAVQDLDSSFTISMWVKGDLDKQPQNDNLFEALYQGGRVLNVHLPWGGGVVYFDAGGRLSGNNNRLAKQADAGEYMGRWNHWAFTKDVRSGMQRIYVNGKLWHEAGNMFKTIDALDSFIIGANGNANGGWYAGSLDEIRIWDIALDEETIAAWRYRQITPEHPFYSHLKVVYPLDDIDGNQVFDHSSNGFDGEISGQPQPIPFGFYSPSDSKPMADATVIRDSLTAPQVTISFHEDSEDPGRVTSELDVWPALERVFNADGQLMEERLPESFDILENGEHIYYDPPHEVVDEIEIGRFITPYGKGLDLGEDGFTWIYDVTDYAQLLQGRVDLQAANDFELLDLTFAFIPGDPPREVISVEKIWDGGNYKYDDLADNQELKPVRLQLTESASGFRVRTRISGHGHAGPDNCCEWDAKDHFLLVNGIERFRWNLWRDCGFNPVYPQGGTWQFDRAGWCPGTWVDTYDFDLTPFVRPGQEVILDYGIEPIDPDKSGEEDGRYYTEFQLISYGPIQHKRDAEIVSILAPSDKDEYGRMNPISLNPVIEIRNLGSDMLTTLQVEYGLSGHKLSRIEWQGSLAFDESEIVFLPIPDWFGMDNPGTSFTVLLKKPNGRRDQNRDNNKMISIVTPPTILPDEFILHMELPGFGRAADNTAILVNSVGDTLFHRNDFADDDVLDESIRLIDGAYELVILDAMEDGLIRHWWLRGYDPDSIGENGRIQIRSVSDSVLVDLGYDFAEKESLQFFVGKPR